MLDLKPMLTTLSKISADRVLALADAKEEDDLCTATIPVTLINPGDKTDRALRRYIKDWIREQGKFSAEVRFQKLKHQSWYNDEREETPIQGAIIVTWWPRPDVPEWEELKNLQARKFKG